MVYPCVLSILACLEQSRSCLYWGDVVRWGEGGLDFRIHRERKWPTNMCPLAHNICIEKKNVNRCYFLDTCRQDRYTVTLSGGISTFLYWQTKYFKRIRLFTLLILTLTTPTHTISFCLGNHGSLQSWLTTASHVFGAFKNACLFTNLVCLYGICLLRSIMRSFPSFLLLICLVNARFSKLSFHIVFFHYLWPFFA